MHYKDGTPARLGDIVQHDSGAVGIVIGGRIGSDYCSTHVVKFEPCRTTYGYTVGAGYVGSLYEMADDGSTIKAETRAAVTVSFDQGMQTRECVKIGHVNIGHG